MTKEREALSFDEAVMKVGLELTWEKAAKVVWRSVKQVRNWSDPDKGAPDIQQALALDVAFVRKGRGRPPLLSSYIHQLEQETGTVVCQEALADLVMSLARESAESIAASMQAIRPDATDEAKRTAVRELREQLDAGEALLRRLTSELQGPSLRVAS